MAGKKNLVTYWLIIARHPSNIDYVGNAISHLSVCFGGVLQ